MAQKPSIPKGTRDFGHAETAERNYIFDTVSRVFRKYGYAQIETPAMENLTTLLGKYGDSAVVNLIVDGQKVTGVTADGYTVSWQI